MAAEIEGVRARGLGHEDQRARRRAAVARVSLRRTIALEYLLMVAVFATTVVLTTFYSP